MGSPEEIQSQLLADGGDTQTLILHAVLALGGSVYHDQLIELLENSLRCGRESNRGLRRVGTRTNYRPIWQRWSGAQLLDEEPRLDKRTIFPVTSRLGPLPPHA